MKKGHRGDMHPLSWQGIEKENADGKIGENHRKVRDGKGGEPDGKKGDQTK